MIMWDSHFVIALTAIYRNVFPHPLRSVVYVFKRAGVKCESIITMRRRHVGKAMFGIASNFYRCTRIPMMA